MKHSWLFVLPFASLCPFNAFGFPSVSRFWAAPNPDWLNELRSDYPLNSACIGWSYFDRGPQRNAVCVSLPSNDSALLNRCSLRSRFLADECCAGFNTSVQALGPCAADSRTNRRTTLMVRSELSVERDSCPTLRRARVCCRIEPLSFAPSRASRSGQQFLMMYGDVLRGVADQCHKLGAERADSPCCF
jgi:hypothetical protein